MKVTELRRMIAQAIPEVVEAVVAKAKDGDMMAAKLLLERIVPSVKSVQHTGVDGKPLNNSMVVTFIKSEEKKELGEGSKDDKHSSS